MVDGVVVIVVVLAVVRKDVVVLTVVLNVVIGLLAVVNLVLVDVGVVGAGLGISDSTTPIGPLRSISDSGHVSSSA